MSVGSNRAPIGNRI